MLLVLLKETRLEQYHNYVNLREVVDQNQDRLNKEKTEVSKVRPSDAGQAEQAVLESLPEC